MAKTTNSTTKLGGYEFYESLGSPKLFVAPMVDQSELPFRMLCRRYGADICYTPMFHSRLFVENKEYRERIFHKHADDRPLVVQFCGNDPETVLKAAKHVENDCDAVDLNLGCPQGIAKKGRYGAFLMHEPDVVRQIVEKLHRELAIPVFCKIRLLPKYEDTLKFALMLEKAGCQLLVVHGRTKEENKTKVGKVNWNDIKQLKKQLSIPVIANGGIETMDDVEECLNNTGVNGVMSSEGILENPSLFSRNISPKTNQSVNQIDLALEYLDLCDQYMPQDINANIKMIRGHMFKFLFQELRIHTDLRSQLGNSRNTPTKQAIRRIVLTLKDRAEIDPIPYEVYNSWYYRHRRKQLQDELAMKEAQMNPQKPTTNMMSLSCYKVSSKDNEIESCNKRKRDEEIKSDSDSSLIKQT